MRAHGSDVGERDRRPVRRGAAAWSASTRCTCSSYPHQLSGGMRQRSMIAMALLFTPDLVIMDEPTSALDVVAQRSLMVQIKELQQAARLRGRLRHPRHVAGQPLLRPADGDVRRPGGRDRRRPGRCSTRPLHPYTQGLLEAFPSIRGPAGPAHRDPGQPARPGPAAGRLPVPRRAARRSMRRVHRDRRRTCTRLDGGAGPLPAARAGRTGARPCMPRPTRPPG